MHSSFARVAGALAFGVLLAACPPADDKGAPPRSAAPSACTRFGQTCEVSPGKLGTCVQKDDCAPGAACLVCQSQH